MGTFSILMLWQEGIEADLGRVEEIAAVIEEDERRRSPPEATVARRAKSYSDFYHVVRAHTIKERKLEREKRRPRENIREDVKTELDFRRWYNGVHDELLDASHEEYKYVQSKWGSFYE